MAPQDDLLACAVSAWYPQFRHVTFKTALVPLPQEFVQYLVADGVHVHGETEAFTQRAADPYASDDDAWSSSGSDAGEAEVPQFPELLAQIRAAIEELGGAVAPKFTWSCPKDAVWMTLGQTLACHNPDEVVLLLKSSDRVAHDICHALEGWAEQPPATSSSGSGSTSGGSAQSSNADASGGGERREEGPAVSAGAAGSVPHVLALRRWHDLRPEREFRCFVRGHELVGISQRDVTEHFPSLEADRAEIQRRIQEFHAQHIKGRFPLAHFTYDVYVAATAEAVKLIDFNPVGGTTAPLLFRWEDLGYGDALPQPEHSLEPAVVGPDGLPRRQQQQGQEGQQEVGPGPGSRGMGEEGRGCAEAGEPAAQEAPPAAAVTADAAYLQQLRQVQALSLGDGPAATVSGGSGGAAAGCGCGVTAPCGSAAQQQQQQQQQPESKPRVPAAAAAVAAAAPGEAVAAPAALSTPAAPEFRIITEAVAMRPNKLAYGVPFDFVDDSEGSALDQLMKQMGGGAEDLLAALRAQAA